MTTITAILIFILGTVIGSFLSVILYRIRKRMKGIIFGKSICPHCNKKLKWTHLIPILSYIFLKGKCAFCNKKISIKYLLIEITTGAVFLLVFLNWNFIEPVQSIITPHTANLIMDWAIFEQFIFYTIISTFLIAILFYDILYMEIPDQISLPAIAVAIAGALVIGNPKPYDMLIGAGFLLALFGIQYLVSKGKWIGGGDIRLGILMGIILGFYKTLGAIIIAYVGGTLIILPFLIAGKLHKKSLVPFGPFLILGTFIMLFFGNEIIEMYLNLLYA